ncbi:cytochrome P450 [Diaporthe sp. PMI_573]|nr:cytochrome P450 [Diaporthaceae sp. PMI_573]
MIFLLLFFLTGPVLLFLSTISALRRNYCKARKIGLPILIQPVSYSNPLWLMIGRHVAPWFKHLPFGLGKTVSRIGYSGWEWSQKHSIHHEYGPGFVIVTPVQNWLYTCDGETLYGIFYGERQGSIERPTELWAMLNCFGPNVITATGEDWRRHRKVTAAAFTERTSRLAWDEALKQAGQVLSHWESAGPKGVKTTPRDCKTVALNILVSAGFGRSCSFTSSESEGQEGHDSTKGEIRLILENILVVFLLGAKTLGRIKWPASLARVGKGFRSFQIHMKNDFETAKAGLGEKGSTEGTLMANLVRAFVESEESSNFSISEQEVFGNMFAYNFSGHDTTARSLNFTFYLLAAYPEVQDWVREEIRHVLGGGSTSTPSYESVPRLIRCAAVMHEVLRLYHVLGIVPRRTQRKTDLVIGGNTYSIPPQTLLLFNMHAAHADPGYWGDDSLEFKPSRWIERTPTTTEDDGSEALIKPLRTVYMSWLDASHVCPGKRFSQVEYVGLMVGLLGTHYVEPARESLGEDIEHARQRTKDCLADSGTKLVFEMLRPETVPLVWRRCKETTEQ